MFEYISVTEVIEGVLAIVGVASIVATRTPTKWDNLALNILSKVIHVLGQNYGQAKNKK
jgi:hypothetical protein